MHFSHNCENNFLQALFHENFCTTVNKTGKQLDVYLTGNTEFTFEVEEEPTFTSKNTMNGRPLSNYIAPRATLHCFPITTIGKSESILAFKSTD